MNGIYKDKNHSRTTLTGRPSDAIGVVRGPASDVEQRHVGGLLTDAELNPYKEVPTVTAIRVFAKKGVRKSTFLPLKNVKIPSNDDFFMCVCVARKQNPAGNASKTEREVGI